MCVLFEKLFSFWSLWPCQVILWLWLPLIDWWLTTSDKTLSSPKDLIKTYLKSYILEILSLFKSRLGFLFLMDIRDYGTYLTSEITITPLNSQNFSSSPRINSAPGSSEFQRVFPCWVHNLPLPLSFYLQRRRPTPYYLREVTSGHFGGLDKDFEGWRPILGGSNPEILNPSSGFIFKSFSPWVKVHNKCHYVISLSRAALFNFSGRSATFAP
jgi:hypothetical protein